MRIILYFILSFSVFLSSCNPQDEVNVKNSDLSVGDYLQRDYIRKLKVTKSPYMSSKGLFGILSLKVSKERGQIIITLIGSFHEGIGAIVLNKDGKILKRNLPNMFTDFRILGKNELSLRYKGKIFHYQYVKNIDYFIRKVAIVGKYLDNKKNIYSFDSTGKAQFRGTSMIYNLSYDPVTDYFDVIYIKDKKQKMTLAYKIINNQLLLYELEGENYQKIANKPLVVLQKITRITH